ncbi:hypothetical protein PS833_03064 [Pseudomonas fluorescens]|uniref:Uncharacterized protein n=1 Tax=Pseudomonas fluorescens TaxID=294 RepID=A0A5E7CMS7_PSEFL|nr:hypothetical protein PS833_03064 [Pseudomonas fluorescens]
MDVNDDEGCLGERGALELFASKLAPTQRRGRASVSYNYALSRRTAFSFNTARSITGTDISFACSSH